MLNFSVNSLYMIPPPLKKTKNKHKNQLNKNEEFKNSLDINISIRFFLAMSYFISLLKYTISYKLAYWKY